MATAEPTYGLVAALDALAAEVKKYESRAAFLFGGAEVHRAHSAPKIIWEVLDGQELRPNDARPGYPQPFASDVARVRAYCYGDGTANAADRDPRRAEYGASERLAGVLRWAINQLFHGINREIRWDALQPDGVMHSNFAIQVEFQIRYQLVAPRPETTQVLELPAEPVIEVSS